MPSGSDIYGFPGSHGYHAMTPENGALEVCYGCGDPMCETDYIDWTEFFPADFGPYPDPCVAPLCEGCAYVFEIDADPEEFYCDESLHPKR